MDIKKHLLIQLVCTICLCLLGPGRNNRGLWGPECYFKCQCFSFMLGAHAYSNWRETIQVPLLPQSFCSIREPCCTWANPQRWKATSVREVFYPVLRLQESHVYSLQKSFLLLFLLTSGFARPETRDARGENTLSFLLSQRSKKNSVGKTRH